MRRVAESLATRGISVVTFNFPYMEAGRGAPNPGPQLEAAFADVWREVAATARGPLFAGGKSMGGRISSQAAAKRCSTRHPPASSSSATRCIHPASPINDAIAISPTSARRCSSCTARAIRSDRPTR